LDLTPRIIIIIIIIDALVIKGCKLLQEQSVVRSSAAAGTKCGAFKCSDTNVIFSYHTPPSRPLPLTVALWVVSIITFPDSTGTHDSESSGSMPTSTPDWLRGSRLVIGGRRHAGALWEKTQQQQPRKMFLCR